MNNQELKSWIRLSEEHPEGVEKVLILRVLPSNQSSQAVSIIDIRMLNYCNKNETWWAYIPQLPADYLELQNKQL